MVAALVELAELDGLITPEIGEVLYRYAARVPVDRAIVELGSYRGKSTCYLAAGALSGRCARVHAVDAWSTGVSDWRRSVMDRLPSPEYDEFTAQLRKAGVESHVTPYIGLTTDAAVDWVGPPVGLLYIDADHSMDAALADFRSWWPHLADDAIVIFDDYDTPTNPGVLAAVTELTESGEYDYKGKSAERLAIGGVG